MDLLVFVFLVAATFMRGTWESSISSNFPHDEGSDDRILDDVIPDSLSRNVVKYPGLLWPEGIVYYRIHRKFDNARVSYIKKAMHAISRVSCVRFVEAPKNATAYLHIIVTRKGCRSNIGYIKNSTQNMYLALDELDTGCFVIGTLIHEFMHVLGFIHQHQTPNRDQYIRVIRENINSDRYSHFEKYKTNFFMDFDPYDFGSIMHYPLLAFSKNGKRTMEPIVNPGDVVIGQRQGLSRLDILKLNKLYKCCP